MELVFRLQESEKFPNHFCLFHSQITLLWRAGSELLTENTATDGQGDDFLMQNSPFFKTKQNSCISSDLQIRLAGVEKEVEEKCRRRDNTARQLLVSEHL